MKNKKLIRITRTAVFIALLLTAQAILKMFGQYVLGSVVNIILVTAVIAGGFWEGLTVSVLSPLLAFFLGFGPALPQIVPIIMLGNTVLITVWFLAFKKVQKRNFLFMLAAAIVAAFLKFIVLWAGVVKITIPLLNIQNPKASVISAAFSYPQLITAAIGGIVASLILPPLIRVVKKDV